MKLHLGCGKIVYEGWINIDLTNEKADRLDDMCVLSSYEKEIIDEIYSSHAIEHISPSQFRMALKRWYELLKKGGRITLRTPNSEDKVKENPEILHLDILPSDLCRPHPSWKHRFDMGYMDKNYFSEGSLRNYVIEAGYINLESRIVSQRHSVEESFRLYGMDEGIIDERPLRDIWLRAYKND